MPVSFRGRYVFPVDAPAIEGGFVTIRDGRIEAVGGGDAVGEQLDLGNVAIVPGFVNAHTHLEFSDLETPLPKGQSFADWIRQVVGYRRQTNLRAANPVGQGLRECFLCGTTAVGEIATPGWSSAAFHEAPLEVTVFAELLGLSAARIEPNLELARQHLAAATSGWRAGLSPHAPYTVHQELFERALQMAREANVPVAMHLAETREELELLKHGTGPLRTLLEEFTAWDPTAIRPGSRPLDYLRTLAAADRALVIHGNYLDEEELSFLAQHRDRLAIVYCPRTHAYFEHAPYPLPRLLRSGVTVALGTDSRASNPDLSLLEELRLVARRFPELASSQILALGTLGGATALGLEQVLGSLTPGKVANLAVLSLPDRDPPASLDLTPEERWHRLLWDPASHVSATIHRGTLARRASAKRGRP